MKPYRKPILAVDSPWCIVLDDKVKHVSLWTILLRIINAMGIATLTVYGLIGGVTSKFAHDKLVSLDEWFKQPANERLAFYYFIGIVVVFLGLMVSVWAYKRWWK